MPHPGTTAVDGRRRLQEHPEVDWIPADEKHSVEVVEAARSV